MHQKYFFTLDANKGGTLSDRNSNQTEFGYGICSASNKTELNKKLEKLPGEITREPRVQPIGRRSERVKE